MFTHHIGCCTTLIFVPHLVFQYFFYLVLRVYDDPEWGLGGRRQRGTDFNILSIFFCVYYFGFFKAIHKEKEAVFLSKIKIIAPGENGEVHPLAIHFSRTSFRPMKTRLFRHSNESWCSISSVTLLTSGDWWNNDYSWIEHHIYVIVHS